MQFVRGESTDSESKGERYTWGASRPGGRGPRGLPAREPSTGGAARRGGAEHDAEDSYWDDDEEDHTPAQAAGVDPDDPLEAYMASLQGRHVTASKQSVPATGHGDADGDDPLDAYMASLESKPAAPAADRARVVGQCDEEEDHIASFLEAAASGAAADHADGSDDGGSGVGDGRSGPRRQLGKQGKQLELLEAVDHDAITYESFEKDLYSPHPTIRAMTSAEVAEYRRELNVSCSGFDVPAPIRRFEHAGLTRELLQAVRRHGYEEPTPIQCQALPVAMSGRDVIAVAATGSGKTAAYVLPAAVHMMAQPELRKGDGPIVLVCCPTHELAEQIVAEGRRFVRGHGLRCVGLFGGVGKYEQFKELKAGCEMVVGTPGRLLELIKHKGGLSRRRASLSLSLSLTRALTRALTQAASRCAA